jgi:anti-sigma regulatory factor (Ser/Thr protein kinase)
VSASGPGELLRLGLVGEHDVFLVRQRGREVAALVGLENQDQVRVATAC